MTTLLIPSSSCTTTAATLSNSDDILLQASTSCTWSSADLFKLHHGGYDNARREEEEVVVWEALKDDDSQQPSTAQRPFKDLPAVAAHKHKRDPLRVSQSTVSTFRSSYSTSSSCSSLSVGGDYEEQQEEAQVQAHNDCSTMSSKTELNADADDAEIARFDRKELVIGRFLGRGRFSFVEEICAFRLGAEEEQTKQFCNPLKHEHVLTKLADDNSEEEKDETSPRMLLANNSLCPYSGDARYAMKRLRPSVLRDPDLFKTAAADLCTETRLLSRLDHHNIIKIRAVAANCTPSSEDYFLVLDRLYDTLRLRIRKWKKQKQQSKKKMRWHQPLGFLNNNRREYNNAKTLLFREQLRVARDMSSALSYLHSQGVCHRDITPANFGFDEKGDIKMFDFGLARELPPASERQRDGTFRNLSLAGTRRYMAPEVGLGKPYNEGCDVYSFCILFWEMLSLEAPFAKVNHTSFVDKVFRGGLRPPLSKRKRWPRSINELLERGWTENVQDRISMTEVTRVLWDEYDARGVCDDRCH